MGIFDWLFGEKEPTRNSKDVKKEEVHKPEKKMTSDSGGDLENYMLYKDSGYSDEFKFLKLLLTQLKTEKIQNEEDLENYIKDHFKKFDQSQLLLKQSLFKDIEKILGTYLNDFEKNKKTTTLFNKKFDFTISFDDVEQYHSLSQKIYGIAGFQAIQKTLEKSELKDISDKEKNEINKKVYGKLSTKQIKDRQVYGAVRAYAELMKIDGDIDPNEALVLGKLSEKEAENLSGDYSVDSEEFKFVWASEENVFTSLKTYNKKQIKGFFENLFVMAAIDGEVKNPEIDFMVTMYKNITGSDEKKSNEDVQKMFENWLENPNKYKIQ